MSRTRWRRSSSGILFRYAPGDSFPPGTQFTRASGAAKIDNTNSLSTKIAGLVRDDFYYGGLTRVLMIEKAATNLLVNPTVPATQTLTALAAGTYTASCRGNGNVTLSGGAAGVVTINNPLTFTLGAPADVIFTVTAPLSVFQCETGTYPTTFVNGTRVLEVLTIPFALNTVPITVYISYLELGTVQTVNGGIFRIGQGNPRMQLYSPGGTYKGLYNNNVDLDALSQPANIPAYGDSVEALLTLEASGGITHTQSINGAAATVGLKATPAAGLSSAWSAGQLTLGNMGGSFQGAVGIKKVLIATGLHTLAEMAAL